MSNRSHRGTNVLAVGLSDRMFAMVSKATDVLKLPSNQDFALRSMAIVLRSMGIAPKLGRPSSDRQRRATTETRTTSRDQKPKGRRR